MVEELNDDTNALGMLRREHNAIHELLATCNEADQPEFATQVMVPLLEALKIHATIEREFFFPFIEPYVDEERMLAPQDDNTEIELLAMKLRDLEPSDPGYDRALMALTETFQHHCYMEEEYLFLPVEGKDPDTHNELILLANKMKRRRTEMLNDMRRSDGLNLDVGGQVLPDSDQEHGIPG